jgi:hypothetical protein
MRTQRLALMIAPLIAVVTFSPIIGLNSAFAIEQGQQCPSLNKTTKVNGVTWNCILRNGNLIWDEKLTWGVVSLGPGQVVEGFRDIATGKTTLVPTVLMARLGKVSTRYIWSIRKESPAVPGFINKFISPFGIISGVGDIPAGTHWILVEVRDNTSSNPTWSWKPVKLNITECNSQFSIEEGAVNALCPSILFDFPAVSNYLISPKKNQPYAHSLLAFGGSAPYKWEFVGTKPLNLKIDQSSGVLFGTIKKSGLLIFRIRVTDMAGSFKDQIVRLKVLP